MEKRKLTTTPDYVGKRALMVLTCFVVLAAGIFIYSADNMYRWIKALHIIAVISWMAGLLYLPRLFIYHADTERGSEQSATFKLMEQRLLRIIMNPAMMLTWLLGLYLAWAVYGFHGGWLQAKIALVITLTAAHIRLSRAVRAFMRDENRHSARYWRFMNEVPAVLMFGIVVLVVVKPF